MANNSPFIIIKDKETKNIDFSSWGGFENFLRDTSNGAGGYAALNVLKRISPFLSRAVDMTANAVANLPFDILDDNGDIMDRSEDWQNKIGGISNPRRLLYNLASSLCAGKAYIIPQFTGTMITDLRYVATHTVLPLITTQGLQWFSRASDYGNAGVYSPIIPFTATKSVKFVGEQELDIKNSVTYESVMKESVEKAVLDNAIKNYNGDIEEAKLMQILTEQNNQNNFNGAMMYFWLPDSDIEIGSAKKYPLGAAMTAAKLAASMDSTLAQLAERSFVPATLVSAKGIPPADREATRDWLNGFLKGAYQSVYRILNADVFTTSKVGAGMDDLKGSANELKRQAIEEIGAAFGIPAALFLSDKAFASEVYPMVKQWYETATFVLIYQTIQETFNEQLLSNYGWQWKFDLERLSAFQEDESKRAASFRDYASARVRPSIAFQILGGKMPEGYEYSDLDENFDKPETNLPVNPIGNPELPIGESKDPAANPSDAQNADAQPMEPVKKAIILTPNEMKEIGLWYEVSKKKFLKGEGTAADWSCKFLTDSVSDPIRAKLSAAQNELDIVKSFEIESVDVGYIDPLKELAIALNRYADAERE